MTKKTSPFGSWKSPITSEQIIAGAIGIGELALDGDNVYWLEGRPSEAGRVVIMLQKPDGSRLAINPAPFNARSRVHEYGGGSYKPNGEKVYFVNFSDQRIYQTVGHTEPEPITPEAPWRYADLIIDESRNRIICVREDHSQKEQEAENTLVAVSFDKAEQNILVGGSNFYASPRLSPDGKKLSWLSWNHPNMPWDGTELWVGILDELGQIQETQLVAGGVQESIFQPEWSPDGLLYFASDRSDWWNLYRWTGKEIEAIYPMEAEFGRPQWVFNMSTYGFLSSEQIACVFTQHGNWQLGILNLPEKSLETFDLPFTAISDIRAYSGKILITASSPNIPTSVVMFRPRTKTIEVIQRSMSIEFDPGYVSEPLSIEFPTSNSQTAHALFYPPKNRDFQASSEEKPPLLVISHGGPTSASDTSLKLSIQFWTSRGFGVLDVNYGGSTGYGRPYRERLNHQWGIVDVDDCTNGALYVARQGWVDQNRLAIRGGSAGGYTTLSALTFRDVFHAGASHFGVSDLEALATETHKFESRYLDKMVAPYPEGKTIYIERSPIHHTDKLSAPLIFFQGLDDKVVLPNQSEIMVTALQQKGVPVAYIAYEGEGHGFRKGENIKRTLDAELYFYQSIFDIPVDLDLEAVEIFNLPG